MAKEGYGLIDYARVAWRGRTVVVLLTVMIVLAVGGWSVIAAKYASQAKVGIGSVGQEMVFTPEEAQVIIQSSVVLDPVLKKYYSSDKSMTIEKFNSKVLEVRTIVEKVGIGQTKTIPYVQIIARTRDAQKSRDIVDDIVVRFIWYGDKKIDKHRKNYIDEYNLSVEASEYAFAQSISNIKSEQDTRKGNMARLQNDISSLESMINSDVSPGLGTEGLSKTLVLRALADSNRYRLSDERNRIADLDKQLTAESVNLQRSKESAKVDLERKLTGIDDFQVIDEPTIQKDLKLSEILQNLAFAFIIGLPLSVLAVLFREYVRSQR